MFVGRKETDLDVFLVQCSCTVELSKLHAIEMNVSSQVAMNHIHTSISKSM